MSEENAEQVWNIILNYCNLVSLACLASTFFIYLLIPSIHNARTRYLIFYISAMLVALPLGGFLRVPVRRDWHSDSWECKIAPVILQFGLICGLCWLNVMCIDMRSIITSTNVTRSPLQETNRAAKFYHLYAWGFPATLVLITNFIQYCPNIPKFIPRPGFGERNICWFNNGIPKLTYLFSVIFISLCFNLWMFISTYRFLQNNFFHTSTASSCSSQGRRIKRSRYRKYILHIKIFLAMNGGWLTTGLLHISPAILPTPKYFDHVISHISVDINSLVIFILYTCRYDVLATLNANLFPRHIVFDKNSGNSSGELTTSERESNTKV